MNKRELERFGLSVKKKSTGNSQDGRKVSLLLICQPSAFSNLYNLCYEPLQQYPEFPRCQSLVDRLEMFILSTKIKDTCRRTEKGCKVFLKNIIPTCGDLNSHQNHSECTGSLYCAVDLSQRLHNHSAFRQHGGVLESSSVDGTAQHSTNKLLQLVFVYLANCCKICVKNTKLHLNQWVYLFRVYLFTGQNIDRWSQDHNNTSFCSAIWFDLS